MLYAVIQRLNRLIALKYYLIGKAYFIEYIVGEVSKYKMMSLSTEVYLCTVNQEGVVM